VSPSSCANDVIDIIGVVDTISLDTLRLRGCDTGEEAARFGEAVAEAEGESEGYVDEAYADEAALQGLPWLLRKLCLTNCTA